LLHVNEAPGGVLQQPAHHRVDDRVHVRVLDAVVRAVLVLDDRLQPPHVLAGAEGGEGRREPVSRLGKGSVEAGAVSIFWEREGVYP
jgi:hypothetical protein